MSNAFDSDDSFLERPLFVRINSDKDNDSYKDKCIVPGSSTVTSTKLEDFIDLHDTSSSSLEVIEEVVTPAKECDFSKSSDLDLLEGIYDNFDMKKMTCSSPIKSPCKMKKKNDKQVRKTPIKVFSYKSRSEERTKLKASKELIKQREKIRKEVMKSKTSKNSGERTIAEVDQLVMEIAGEEIRQVFAENGFQCRESQHDIARSVTWIKLEKRLEEEDDEIELQVTEEEIKQKHLLIVLPANDFVLMVEAYNSGSSDTVYDFVMKIKQQTSCLSLSLIIFKLDAYFRRENSKSTNAFKSRFNQIDSSQSSHTQTHSKTKSPSITKDDVDLATIDLDVKLNDFDSSFKCSVTYVNTAHDLATLIFRYTKSIAEGHLRLAKNQFSWYAEADNKFTVDPKEPEDYHKLWRKQLMQFPKVSVDIANSIAQKYPSPKSLLSAFAHESKPENLLETVMVTRQTSSGASSQRRVGPEISKRIHLFMTGTIGDELLNKF